MISGLFRVWWAFHSHNTLWSCSTPNLLSIVISTVSSICFKMQPQHPCDMNASASAWRLSECQRRTPAKQEYIQQVRNQGWCWDGEFSSNFRTPLTSGQTIRQSARLTSGSLVAPVSSFALIGMEQEFSQQKNALSHGLTSMSSFSSIWNEIQPFLQPRSWVLIWLDRTCSSTFDISLRMEAAPHYLRWIQGLWMLVFHLHQSLLPANCQSWPM